MMVTQRTTTAHINVVSDDDDDDGDDNNEDPGPGPPHYWNGYPGPPPPMYHAYGGYPQAFNGQGYHPPV